MAQSCGIIGNSDSNEVNDRSERRFYLDINNPATCSGIVTSWTVCYHGRTQTDPAPRFGASYWATYAVYRRTDSGEGGEERYERVSEMFRAVRATINFGEHVDGVLQEGFSCYNDSDNSTLTIQAGDIIGACIFDPEDTSPFVGRHQLDIVGQVRGESLSQLQSDVCTMDAIPSSIPYSDLLIRDNRRLHIYANIGSYQTYIAT